MNYDLQRASMTKRLSAWLLDVILLACLTVGLAAALSFFLGFDEHSARVEQAYEAYGQMYDVDFNISAEEFEKLSEEDLARYNAASEAINRDEGLMKAYSMTVSLSLLITALAILGAYLLLEFAVPMLLRNGQTIGKKVFGIALMRNDGVRITTFMLFVRTVLGKYTLGTMFPVMIGFMILLQVMGLVGVLVLALLLLLQMGLLIFTKNHTAIHDLVACTVAVDMASQLIFNTAQERLDYQKRVNAERAMREQY